MAQTPSSNGSTPSLAPVVITEKAEAPQGKDSLRTTKTQIGKGNQELRDIPQSITVVTEKLVDDRNLDTLKDVLHNTAGVTFLAAEGGEEDIRLRGFSLATTGDIFLDGTRDPAFYDRDTFNNDRIELLRGSASMLFGRGSTGGAVNQVTKQAHAMDEHEIATTLGSYNYRRMTGDFNIQTGEDAALRINAMATKADNNGAGISLDKKGLAANYRHGIGTADEIGISVYSLRNNNGMNYGMPYIRPYQDATAAETSLLPINPNSNYGMASDYNKGTADHLTLSHTHRFADHGELKTQLRSGVYTRDLRSGTVRINGNTNAAPSTTNLNNFSDATVLNRGNQNKIQDLHGSYAQSDYSTKRTVWGIKHEVLAGFDVAMESKNGYSASTPSPAKPSTTVGSPSDGAWIDETARAVRKDTAYEADNLGLYAQDMVQVAEHWKVLGGLRFDRMRSSYKITGTTVANTGVFDQTFSEWSKRVGVLYQPSDRSSYHFSWGTSFNASADVYSYAFTGANGNTARLAANTPPEESRNIEIGAKLDSADHRFTTRLAIFHSVKFNERNTDPDSAASQYLLSGKRHTSGFEIDLTGRITPKWEVFGSYMWMPDAMIDVSNSTSNGAREGERPGLIPIHSGTVWNTYQFTSQLRLGAGVNFRSEQAPATAPGFVVPAYATLDLMGEYKFNDRYNLKVNLANALDKLYADALYTGHYIPGAGRTLQATLTAKF
jgi:catecholate siderophore receptor